jgi:hypothetical protein
MNYQLFDQRSLRRLAAALFLSLLVTVAALGQAKEPTLDQFLGNYKGTAKMTSGQMDLTVEIKAADGKVSGRAVTTEREYQIASGEIAGGKLNLKLGAGNEAATLTLQKVEDKLVGDWIRGDQKATVELKKAEPESISGEWEAVADAQGQAFPFLLTLKVEGEKVTGTSSSQLGTSQISSGTWKDGKLAVTLEGGAGQIALVATMIEGKLSGDYDFAGQLSGKWVAIKKK